MKKRKIVFSLIIAITWLSSQESNAQITGRVTDANQQPIPHVNIIVKETGRGTLTDERGDYSIMANSGDTLLFSHVGRQPVEVHVKESPSVTNVVMEAATIELVEVEIESRRRHKTQKDLLKEYPENMNLIKTTWGILDKDRSSTAMRIIAGKDMIPVGTDFLYSLQDHCPHMRVVRDDPDVPDVLVYLRQFTPAFGSSPPTALFDVDGFIQGATPTHLSANDIDRIAIFEGNAAIIRYGPQAVGGVIVVNTKAQTWMDDMGVERVYNNRALVDSLIREVAHIDEYQPHKPPYIEKLHKAKTEKEALAIHTRQQKRHLDNPYYFLDVYDYFLSRWGNTESSKEMFQHVINNYSNDIPALRAMAYLQQQYGNYENALSIYLEILKLRDRKAQSHRDVANAFADAGNCNAAIMTYTQYLNIIGRRLPDTPFDAYGEDQLVMTEMINLFERNKEVFPEYNDMVSVMDHPDTLTRLVFEWNNPEAEFELQFVTPAGDYNTWSNNRDNDVSDHPEAEKGYSSKQFFIDRESEGMWKVILDYKGYRSDVPIYLKVSVYHDYGLPSQQVEINVYKLSEQHDLVQLFTVQPSSFSGY